MWSTRPAFVRFSDYTAKWTFVGENADFPKRGKSRERIGQYVRRWKRWVRGAVRIALIRSRKPGTSNRSRVALNHFSIRNFICLHNLAVEKMDGALSQVSIVCIVGDKADCRAFPV
jgi:hypothetical protein